MSKVSMMVKLIAQDGKRDELVAAFAEYLPQVESEDGTLVYSINTDDGDANTVWIYELYNDVDALASHGGSEAFKAFGAKLGGLLGGAPEMHQCTPAVAKGHAT